MSDTPMSVRLSGRVDSKRSSCLMEGSVVSQFRDDLWNFLLPSEGHGLSKRKQ